MSQSLEHKALLGHDPRYTGIRECYHYVSQEGWHVLYVDCPEQRFVDWLVEFQPDFWIENFANQFYDDLKNHHLIGIKDSKRFMLFKLQWWTEYECYDGGYSYPLDHFFYDYEPYNLYNDGWPV